MCSDLNPAKAATKNQEEVDKIAKQEDILLGKFWQVIGAFKGPLKGNRGPIRAFARVLMMCLKGI